MKLTKGQKQVLTAFIVMAAVFIPVFILQKNYEFASYVVVLFLLAILVLKSSKKILYPNYVLWGLFTWAFLHLLGGVTKKSGSVIYDQMLLPVIGEPYNILKYDQVVHGFGFFVATLVMYFVLKKYLTRDFGWVAVGIVLAMAGLGLGAVNEILEFSMTVALPDTSVGGYENTALDLVFNFIGAVLAVFFLKLKEDKISNVN